jgi:hypothetical protein
MSDANRLIGLEYYLKFHFSKIPAVLFTIRIYHRYLIFIQREHLGLSIDQSLADELFSVDDDLLCVVTPEGRLCNVKLQNVCVSYMYLLSKGSILKVTSGEMLLSRTTAVKW